MKTLQDLDATASRAGNQVKQAVAKGGAKAARFLHLRVIDVEAGQDDEPEPTDDDKRLAAIQTRFEKLLGGKTYVSLPSSVRDALARPVIKACEREAYDAAEAALDDFPKQVAAALATLPKDALSADPQALRKNAKLADAAQGIAAGLSLGGLPAMKEADEIKRLVQAHYASVTPERAMFKGLDTLDDIKRLGPEHAEQKLRKIAGVIDAVAKRGLDLGLAHKAVLDAKAMAKQSGALDADAEAKQDAALETALSVRANIDGHLPDAFRGTRGAELLARIPTLLAPDDVKAAAIAGARRDGIVDANGAPINDQVKAAYKTVIEKSGAKPMERQRFFFDPILQAQDRDSPSGKASARALEKATDAIVAQGQKILDAGGKFDDVRAMMDKTGIPEDWWPPRLVASLQAWRKVEEARIEAAMGKHRKDTVFSREDALSCLGFVADMMAIAGPMVEAFVPVPEVDDADPDDVREATEAAAAHGEMVRAAVVTAETGSEVVHGAGESLVERLDEPAKKQIESFAQNLKSGFGLGPLALEAMQTGDFSDLDPEQIAKLSEAMDSALAGLKMALATAKVGAGIAASAGHAVSGLVPGLGIAVAGVDLAMVAKKLTAQGIKLAQTSGMKHQAYQAMGEMELEDGGAFINSLKNEITARQRQITRTGLEEGSDAVAAMGSSIAITAGAHYGAVAAGVITAVGKTIKYGSKIVFTNINWGRAQRAMAVLEEARAGNPQARVKVFEDSNLYAKMYICCLAREVPPNPLAITFVAQRGITENDLSESKSIEVLSSILLKSAGQTSEEEVSDSRMLEMTGFVGKFAVKAAGATGDALEGAADALSTTTKSDRKIPYNASWTAAAAPSLASADWDSVKKDAYKAGYFDVKTGIGQALQRMAEPLAAAETALTKTFRNPKSDEAAAARKAVLKALEAMDRASAVIRKASPKANPDGKQDHAGMTLYLVGLGTALSSKRNDLETALRDAGLKQTAWQPNNAAPLSGALWRRNWEDGVTLACLPDEDAGVGDALEACEKSETDLDALDGKDKQKARAARLKAMDRYNDLAGCVKACFVQTRDVPAMTTLLDQVLVEIRQKITAHDAQLSGVDWKDPPASAQTADGWRELWDAAADEGFADSKAGDGGLLKALTTLEEASGAMTARKTKPDHKLVKLELEFAEAVGHVFEACDKFAEKQPGVAKVLTDYVDAARGRVVRDSVAVSKARRARTFKPKKANLDASDWKSSFKAAVKAGAVPNAKDAAGDIKRALLRIAKTEDALDEAYADVVSEARQKPSKVNGPFGEYAPMKQALEASAESRRAMKEGIEGHINGKSFDGNSTMDAYLKAIRACEPPRLQMKASLLRFKL